MANWLFAFFVFYSSSSNALSVEEAAASSTWLKIYQYRESSFSSKKTSDVKSARFFFAKNGNHSPIDEIKAAILAYENPGSKFGTQNLSAACVFPARKIVLEKLLNRKFPDQDCPDLKKWVAAVNADQVNIVFAGAYGGNPASALGHTFLRFYNSAKEQTGRAGQDLLSYSVGFMALPESDDIKPLYILRGLTGGYPGYYEIEPHYLKVGLYNNSESRDLWEWPLALSKDESDLLLLYLWELTFNAQFKYYFLGENCSYRLITMLELVRPDLKLREELASVVLPAETVRLLYHHGLIQKEAHYRASIGRRIHMKLDGLTTGQKQLFRSGRKSLDRLAEITDAKVLDVLIDHWTYENYRLRTNLKPEQKNLMNATFLQMAQSSQTPPQPLRDEDVRRLQKQFPLTESHPAQWLALSGIKDEEDLQGKISYRLGTHAMWQDNRGYDSVSWIEYFGIDYQTLAKDDDLWNALLIKAYSLDSIFAYEHRLSWQFETGFSNQCWFCDNPVPHYYFSGGGGVSVSFHDFQWFLMAHLKTETWNKTGLEGILSPGYRTGLQWRTSKLNLLIQQEQHWWRNDRRHELSARTTGYVKSEFEIFAEFKHVSEQFLRVQNQAELGFAYFF